MRPEQEAYLIGFLHAARVPGHPTIRHRDREVMEETAVLLDLACRYRKIPHVRLHHPERPLHGTQTEVILTLPEEILREIDPPLPAVFDRYRPDQPHLERGILEGCGTLCYKKSTRGIGISFTSFDPEWLSALRDEIRKHHPCGPIAETARGSRWFSIEDEATRSYADRLYGDPAAPHSRTRRRKLRRVLGQIGASAT
ncbi:hypothetical protein [Candidatus Manganitrophus noduliformans]|uniref:Uncharacterized protein n=1 Tax=Candidatus Manganitrophus noduliformans TaxID=2606439 RepID=A0A7X6IAI1_9BACT|nr:hypothetical protein [Candidatus Manganitrophus noduliformans]NKE70736.1 hypothetical protein [Candidatus Manganitrophus noduliformans]